MIKTNKLAVVLVLAASGVAQAGGQSGSIGIGAEYQINGLGGASANYDAGDFHVGGFVGFSDADGPDNTVFTVGGRFFYHVHSTAMSDLGVGAGLGIVSFPDPNPPMGMNPEQLTGVYVEPSLQIRLFLASNVALSAATGIVIGVVDADGVAITGQGFGTSLTTNTGNIGLSGGIGIHYYFF